jgi:hypothetical protein
MMRMTIMTGGLAAALLMSGCYKSVDHGQDTSDQGSDPLIDEVQQDPIVDPVVDPNVDLPPDYPPDMPYCTSNAMCGAGQFCEFDPGLCSGAGKCEPRGTGECEEYYAPVCGCDGVTYSNDCFRRYAGVSLLHIGECEVGACFPYDPFGVCGPEEFCEGPEGQCWLDGATGWCQRRPDGCADVWDPVCGCDNVTYGNDCERQIAGVWAAYRGECGPSCFAGDPYGVCDEGEFCEGPENFCDIMGAAGWCTEPDRSCGYLWDPVCGCDGETYSNDCERQMAGVWLRYRGPCEEPPPPVRICGLDYEPCPRGQFCEYPAGDCGYFPDSLGGCMDLPMGCPFIYDPVCGCDGENYDNDCVRQSEGVALCHHGVCTPTSCAYD